MAERGALIELAELSLPWAYPRFAKKADTSASALASISEEGEEGDEDCLRSCAAL